MDYIQPQEKTKQNKIEELSEETKQTKIEELSEEISLCVKVLKIIDNLEILKSIKTEKILSECYENLNTVIIKQSKEIVNIMVKEKITKEEILKEIKKNEIKQNEIYNFQKIYY